MKRTELLTHLISTRAEFQSLLDDLGENHMLQPGAAGAWSVRDVLAHLTACEVEVLTNLGKVRRGAKPGPTAMTPAAIEKQNQLWHNEMKDRPLRSVLADFDGARKQTLRVLEAMSEADAAKPAGWLQGRSLVDYFVGEVLTHEREHLEQLRQWRASGPAPRESGTHANGSGPRAQ